MSGRRRFLTASVISVQNSTFVYPSCQNCFSKLYLDLKRYSCLKCGCSGDAREASYRYRLSLEVTDAHEVFLVTVFGSCLEAFFGVTAKSLQRYIEDLHPDAGEATRDTAPSVVIQAVETCFIGKKFVFGVKESEKQDGASHLQNNSPVDRHPKILTACQMFVPNSGLVGCTVIHYLHQHQCSPGSKDSHGGMWYPGGVFIALDQPSSELSCLHDSGDEDPVPSSHRDCLSNLWPQSFGLTSSSISRGTAIKPVSLGASRATCDEQKWDGRLASLQLHDQSVYNSQDHHLTVSERNVQEDEEFCLCSTWFDSIIFKKNAQSHSSEKDDSRSLQNPLEIWKKGSPNKIGIQHSHCLEKSPNSSLCRRQSYSFCPLVCTSHSRDGGSSQDDSWFWDELPSSESLNEFIARIERSKARGSPTETGIRGHFPSKETGEIRGHANQSPLPLGAASTTSQTCEKLQEVAEKVDVSKESVLSCHQSNWLSLNGKEYLQEVSLSTFSAQRKDEWEHLSSHHQIFLPQLSPLGIKPSGSKESCLSSLEGVGQDVTSCEDHRASFSLKSANNCLENLAHLNCKREDSVMGWRKTANSRCEPKQTSDLTGDQEQGFTSAARDKLERVYERDPFPKVQEKNDKRGEITCLLPDSSFCPQGTYNASADLFDASAVGAEAAEGILTAQTFSAQGGALAAKSMSSGCKPSELESSWNAQSGLSLLDLFATCDPKASIPITGLDVESECSPSGTQEGFVPSMQSTPRVRPCQQARHPRGKEPILSDLPLNKLPWINAKWKRPRPAFKAPLVKQLLSKFLQSRRSSALSTGATDISVTQGLFINSSPAQELAEDNGKEWIPPLEEKRRQPLPFQNRKMFGSRKRSWNLTEKTRFSEKQRKWRVPRGTAVVARTEFTDRSQPPTGATVHEDVADREQVMVTSPGFCTFSNGIRLNLSSTPHSTPRTVNWSPELFGDNSLLLTMKATL